MFKGSGLKIALGGTSVVALLASGGALAQSSVGAGAAQDSAGGIDPIVLAQAQTQARGQAQGAQQAGSADGEGLEEIVITGSRIKRREDTTIDISTIGSEEIELRGFTNIIEGIEQLPLAGAGVNNQGANNQFGENSAFPDLLNLGTQRTLTLVNGRRFVSSNQATVFVPGNANGAQVDLSVYNPALIERTEVLTVGGGPIYGADAVSGVVNIILKDDFEGLNLLAQGGFTDSLDGGDYRLSGLWGENFSGDRGNITVGLEWRDSDLVRSKPGSFNRVTDASTFEFLNPIGGRGTGQPSTFFQTGVTDPRFVSGGVLVNAVQAPIGAGSRIVNFNLAQSLAGQGVDPLLLIGSTPGVGGNVIVVPNTDPATMDDFPNRAVPLRFLPNGDLVPFNIGDVRPPNVAQANAVVGGDGLPEGSFTNIRSAQTRLSFNLLGRYDLTDDITIRQNFIFSRIKNKSLGGPLTNSAFGDTTAGTLAIPVFIDENPLLSDQARGVISDLETLGAQIPTFGGARALFLSRELNDVTGEIFSGNESRTYRTSTVVEGTFNALNRDFTWDVAFIYGRSESDNFDTNLLDVEFALATDVVADANGNPVCRQQTLAAPEPIAVRNPALAFINTGLPGPVTPTQAQIDACVPLNLFGAGQASPEAAAFVTAGSDSSNSSQQFLGAASLQGTIVELPAGPLQFSSNFEWRRESNEFKPGPVFGQGLARNTLGQGSQGALKFFEGGTEFVAPVLDSSFPGLGYMEFNGAVRVVSRGIESRSNEIANESGRVNSVTFTGGGRWQPFDGFTIRGNRTKSVRSPSVVELAGAGVTGFTGGGDSDFACDQDNIDGGPNPAARRANCERAFELLGLGADFLNGFDIPGGTGRPAAGASNPFLENEEAKSWTVGAVWQPTFIPGLTLEADWMSIDLENIIQLSFQVNTCFDSPAFPDSEISGFPACDLFFFNVEPGGPFAPNISSTARFVVPEINPLTDNPVPAVANPGAPAPQQAAGNLSFIFFPTINVASEELRALNTRAKYDFDAEDLFGETAAWLGSFTLDGRVYFLSRRTQFPTGEPEVSDQLAGEIGDPKFSTRLDFTHRIGKFTQLLQWFRTSSTVADVENTAPENELAVDFRFPRTDRFNYTAQYQLTDNLSARLVVDNLTNENNFEITDQLGFDPLGRRFTFVINARF